MLRSYDTKLFVFGYLLIMLCLCGASIADGGGTCSSEGISVIDGVLDEKPVVIRYAGQAYVPEWGTKLLDTKIVRDNKGNSFLFVRLTEGGSCGDGGLLATTSNGRLIFYNFEDSPCGAWRIIEPNKIVFHTVWMDICGLGWCHACGPLYPIIWTIDDCRNGKIIAKRYKDLREVYSDKDCKIFVDNMLKNLREMITKNPTQNPLMTLSDPIEKEFCTRVVKKDASKRALELLFAADLSIGDRFYFFDKTTRNTKQPQKGTKP